MYRIKDITDQMLEKSIKGPGGRTYSAMELVAMIRHNPEDVTDKMLEKCLDGPGGRVYSALEVEATMMEVWSSDACLGYTVMALEALKYEKEAIKQITSRLKHEEFEFVSVQEAAQYYQNSEF